MSSKRSSFLFRNLAPEIRGLSLSRKAVFTRLCIHANHSGSCWPSEATIARDADCDERTVRRSLNDLEELGLIRRRRRSRTGKSGGYVYAIVPPIRHLVHDSGLCVLKHTDTKSGHNYLNKLIHELDGTGLAVCMNEVWKELETVVNFQKLLQVFSLFPLVEHLLNKPDEEAVQGFARLTTAARLMRVDLEASEGRLSSWTQLFPYLKKDAPISVPVQHVRGHSRPCTATDELAAVIADTGIPIARAKLMLEGVEISETGERIVITSLIPARVAALQTQQTQPLRQFASNRRQVVELVVAGSSIERFKPGPSQ